MQQYEQNGVKWLEFELLSQFPRLRHGIYLRHGGFSTGNLTSLNCGYLVGDAPLNVAANIEKICRISNISTLAQVKACHGKEIFAVTSNNHKDTPACDAMATAVPEIGLLIKHADCQAAIFYDPVNHVVANVHSGWRGSVQNIYAETVMFMRAAYGSKPEDIHIGIGPSLGPEDAQFLNYKEELPRHFWDFRIKDHHFDFWEISKAQLTSCGILAHHIEIASISTYAHPEDYFSYRFCKTSGRHATTVKLL